MPEPDAQPPAPATPPASPPPPAAPTAPAGAARPDWAPEKFWDAERGEVRTQDLAKSYAEAQKLIGRRGDEAKAAARQEVEAELFGKRPEKPEAYELRGLDDAVDVALIVGKPGDDFAPEPGKTYLALNPDSKALGMLRGMAHRAGASPEEMQALLTEVARENGQRVPTEADLQAERERVWAELGEHGQRRAQHLWGQMRALLGDRASDLEGDAGKREGHPGAGGDHGPRHGQPLRPAGRRHPRRRR